MVPRKEPRRRLGRYELLCELGRGGMAELQLARLHGVAGFSRLLAVKLILPHLTHEQTFVDQFLNEGRIAARLSHPNVCQVFELGEADGQLYLAMEYLEGTSWEDLAPRLPADPDGALRIVAGVLGQACDGLQHAHDVPIIHRDVSPSNLFVTVNGVCKVLDFGVSKLLSEGKHTRTGVLKGKLPYMSPEQIEGIELDVRSDVWAAGVVAWEALARERLFDRTTDFQIWKAITEEEVPALDAYGPEVNRVLARALTRDREARHPTIRAFADDLRAAAAARAGVATPAELADLVRATCGTELAERTALVTRVTAVDRPQPEKAPKEAPEAPEEAAEEAIDEPSATVSMALRGDSLVFARPRARRWWPLALALVALGAIVAAIALVVTRTPEDARLARLPTPPPPPVETDAAVATAAPDAPPDAAVAAVAVAPPVKAPPPRGKQVTASPPPAPRQPPPSSPPPAPASSEPGLFSIRSRPFARIHIDGTYIDQTPMFRYRLTAGQHRVRAVLEDGRERTFTIDVAPGREVNLGTLTW